MDKFCVVLNATIIDHFNDSGREAKTVHSVHEMPNIRRCSSESLQSVYLPALLKSEREENTLFTGTSHLKRQGIAARQHTVTHPKSRICAMSDFRPFGDIHQNVWSIH